MPVPSPTEHRQASEEYTPLGRCAFNSVRSLTQPDFAPTAVIGRPDPRVHTAVCEQISQLANCTSRETFAATWVGVVKPVTLSARDGPCHSTQINIHLFQQALEALVTEAFANWFEQNYVNVEWHSIRAPERWSRIINRNGPRTNNALERFHGVLKSLLETSRMSLRALNAAYHFV